MAVTITQHIRRMRGGAQSHLMRAADGNFYVVKFQTNPQHVRVLANEWIAGRIAERIGLPAAAAEIVEVGDWLVRKTPELHVLIAGIKKPCTPGLQFGSRFVVDPMDGQVLDYMPESLLDSAHVRNLGVFAGALAFDKWLCNADGRQVVYWRRNRERKYSVALVDQGYCFNAGDWSFPDAPLRGAFAMNAAYAAVRDWNDFEPWLARIEGFTSAELAAYAEAVPPEWYAGDWDALAALIKTIGERRTRVRRLVDEFRLSSRNPFPNWNNEQLEPLEKRIMIM